MGLVMDRSDPYEMRREAERLMRDEDNALVMRNFIFVYEMSGTGRTEQEALENALEAFVGDPGEPSRVEEVPLDEYYEPQSHFIEPKGKE